MKVFKHILSVGLVGVVFVAGSARVASAARPLATLTLAADDDDAIQSRIEANLKKNTILAPRNIDVDVDKGIVKLTGTVRTIEEKARAGEVAKVEGVVRVDNRIEVDPKVDESKIDAAAQKTKSGLNKAVDATATAAHKTKEATEKGVGKTEQGVGKAADKTASGIGKAGDKVGDSAVTTRVKADLSNEPLLKNTAINVDTTDHVVTLKGTVDSEAAGARAAEVAGRTDGVTRVLNQLVVK